MARVRRADRAGHLAAGRRKHEQAPIMGGLAEPLARVDDPRLIGEPGRRAVVAIAVGEAERRLRREGHVTSDVLGFERLRVRTCCGCEYETRESDPAHCERKSHSIPPGDAGPYPSATMAEPSGEMAGFWYSAENGLPATGWAVSVAMVTTNSRPGPLCCNGPT